jgi:sulfonate transport system ATP-binding protein
MLGDRILLIDKGRITMDTRVSLPRPRKRKDREFVTLADQVLERLMGDEAGLINGEQEAIKELASA